MDVCSDGGEPLWPDIAVAARSGLAVGALGDCDRVFCLGSGSAQHVASLLSALDAFWVCDECHYDANRSRRSVLCRSPPIWACISIGPKRPDASYMGASVILLSGQEPQNECQAHGETVLMLEFLKDLWDFMRVRKKFFLAPIIIVLLLLGVLIVFAEGTAVAPFVYTLF